VLGDEHPHTVTSINNLAHTPAAPGDVTTAYQLQLELVTVSRRVHGDDDPYTRMAIENLEALRAWLGRAKR
jgi:hypothetical protein